MKSHAQPSLDTKRFLLRPFSLEDVPRVQLLVSDKRISEMVANIPHPYPEGAALEWIVTHRPEWEKGRQASFAIIDKVTNELRGAIGLSMKVTDGEKEEAEIGYWLGIDYWGQGVVSEACQRIVEFAWDDLSLDRILARRLSSNPASGRVLEKAGFVHTGTEKGNCGDKYTSLDYYEILKP